MPEDVIARASAASQYAKDKSLTTRRSRSAMQIESFLFQSEAVFLRLMRLDEERLRRVAQPWSLSPVAGSYKPPLLIGQHALLAFPGSIIEALDEPDQVRKNRTRLLIKAAVDGVIFNLLGTLDVTGLLWVWTSMEAGAESIRDEGIRSVLHRTKELVRVVIPIIADTVEAMTE